MICTRLKYFRHGIYIEYQHHTTTYRRFIRIATLEHDLSLPLKIYPEKILSRMREDQQELRTKYTDGRISFRRFVSKVNKLRDRYIAVRPLLSSKYRGKNGIEKWKRKRKTLLVRQQLEKLIDDPAVEIQINQLEGDRILPVLVDYGPRYPHDFPTRQIINRSSPVELYPGLKWLKHTIILDPDMRVQIKPYVLRHLQDMQLDEKALYPLFKVSQPDEKVDYSLDTTLLEKYFTMSHSIPSRYICSVGSGPTSRAAKSPTVHYALSPGGILQLQTLQTHHFILNYLYRGQVSSRAAMLGDTTPEKMILLSRSDTIIGAGAEFARIDPGDLRLDLVDFQDGPDHPVFLLINILDIVHGSHYHSVIGDLVRILGEIEEFDRTILPRISSLQQLEKTLARQMTNTSYIGKTDDVVKLYHIIRQTQIGQVCAKRSEPRQRSVSQLPRHTLLTTDGLSSQDATILFLSLILSMDHHLARIKQQDITLVVEDARIISMFYQDDVREVFANLAHPDLKVIFSIPPGNRPIISPEPLLEIDESGSKLSIGTSHTFDVTIDWMSVRQTEQLDRGRLDRGLSETSRQLQQVIP